MNSSELQVKVKKFILENTMKKNLLWGMGILIGGVTTGVSIFTVIENIQYFGKNFFLVADISQGKSSTNIILDGENGLISMSGSLIVSGGGPGTGNEGVIFPVGALQNQRVLAEDILEGTIGMEKLSFLPMIEKKSCEFNGKQIPHLTSRVFYQTPTDPIHCEGSVRTCNDGILDGTGSYESCQVVLQKPKSCNVSPRGVVDHMEAVVAYEKSSVGAGETCKAQSRICLDGTLGGTYRFSSCSAPQGRSCTLPRGGTISHGEGVLAYATDSVTFGSQCSVGVRVCDDGVLGGVGIYQSCSVGQPISCTLPRGGTLGNAQSVIAYSSSVGTFSSPCQPQVRSCQNGILNGGGMFQTCAQSLTTGVSCTLPRGGTLAHGESTLAYIASAVPHGSQCGGSLRTCNNGTLNGVGSYQICYTMSPSSCSLPRGGSISHGQGVLAYNASSVPDGSICQPFARVCSDGVLNGIGSYPTCVSSGGNQCALPRGGTLPHNQAVIAFFLPTVSFGAVCDAHTRFCSNGVLSSTGSYATCTANPGTGCFGTPFGDLIHGQSVTGYLVDVAFSPQLCHPIPRTCYNGTLLGTGNFTGCVQLGSSGQSCTGADFGIVPGDWTGSARTETGLFGGTWTGVYTGIIPHGFSLFPYSSDTSIGSSSCELLRHQRVCINGTLLGTGTYENCTGTSLQSSLIEYYFGTNSSFTDNWSSMCDLQTMKTFYLSGGNNVLTSSQISGNSLYVFTQGDYFFDGVINGNALEVDGKHCVGLVGIGEVNFLTNSQSSGNLGVENSSGVIIDNIVLDPVRNSGAGHVPNTNVVRIDNTHNVTLSSSLLYSGGRQGLSVFQSSRLNLFDLVVRDISYSLGSPVGMMIDSSTDVFLRGTEIVRLLGGGVGVRLQDTQRVFVEQTKVSHTSVGVIISGSTDISFNNSLIYFSSNGIKFVDSTGLSINNSLLFDITGIGSVDLVRSANVFLSNSALYNSNRGIVIDSGSMIFLNNIAMYNNYSGYVFTGGGCLTGCRLYGYAVNKHVDDLFPGIFTGGGFDGWVTGFQTDPEISAVTSVFSTYSGGRSATVSGSIGGDVSSCHLVLQPHVRYYADGQCGGASGIARVSIDQLAPGSINHLYGTGLSFQMQAVKTVGGSLMISPEFMFDVTEKIGGD